MPTIARAEPICRLDLYLDLLHVWQEPHHLPRYVAQEAGSEAEQMVLELAPEMDTPLWGAHVVSGGLTHWTTMVAPQITAYCGGMSSL